MREMMHMGVLLLAWGLIIAFCVSECYQACSRDPGPPEGKCLLFYTIGMDTAEARLQLYHAYPGIKFCVKWDPRFEEANASR